MLEMTLATKVALLLAACMGIGGAGAYCGRNIRTLQGFIIVALLFVFGTIGVTLGAHVSQLLGVLLLGGWTFISGLVIGPAVQLYSEELGWQTVAAAYVGTGGVMTACGILGAFSGIDFSFLGGILFFALLGLVLASFIGVFWRLSRSGNIVQAVCGMLIFAGYFIFDFFRLTKESNTWEHAVNLTMSIYLDYMNFFLHLLQLLSAMQNKH
jgi:FtsH-binding integral membrane protein